MEDGNDKGSWHSWSVNRARQVDTMEAYTDAKSTHMSIKTGEMRVALPAADAISSDEVPF